MRLLTTLPLGQAKTLNGGFIQMGATREVRRSALPLRQLGINLDFNEFRGCLGIPRGTTNLLENEIPINGDFGADGRTPLTEPSALTEVAVPDLFLN